MSRITIYRYFAFVLLKLAKGFHAIFAGFWLGMMDVRHFDQLSGLYYQSGRYLDPDYNKSGLMYWESEIISQYFSDCRSIIVAASGAGRELLALSALGFDLQAFECSQELLDESRVLLKQEGVPVTLHVAEPSSVPPEVSMADGVLVGWGAFMHISGKEKRRNFLMQLHSKIRQGGPILLSFFTRTEESKTMGLTYRVAAWVRKLRGSSEAVELGDRLDFTYDHWFTEAELVEELSEAGFRLVYFNANPYGHAVAIAG